MYRIRFFHEGGIEYVSVPICSSSNALASARCLDNRGIAPLIYETTDKGEKQISLKRLEKLAKKS